MSLLQKLREALPSPPGKEFPSPHTGPGPKAQHREGLVRGLKSVDRRVAAGQRGQVTVPGNSGVSL